MNKIGIVALISAATYGFVMGIYRRFRRLSNFQIAANKLGFKAELRQNEALLKNFHIAGYFKPQNVWSDLNRIGQIKNIETTFYEILKVIQKSRADEEDPQTFDFEYMSKNLFNSKTLDTQDAMDIILYMAQHAFNRKPGQERNELVAEDWMIKNKSLYIEQAKNLGLMDGKAPKENFYDFAWILGASRSTFLKRIVNFNFNLKTYNLKTQGGIMLLAGNRELWANFDKLNPQLHEKLLEKYESNEGVDSVGMFNNDNCLREGMDYIIYLARKFNVKLNENMPFIEYKSIAECPSGRFVNRVYANYATNEENILTETMMAKDLIETDLKNQLSVSYIDTKEFNDARPTTATTVRDATEECIRLIENGKFLSNKKEFKIILESNNPYIERQTLTSQQEVDKVVKLKGLDKKGFRFKIEGVGSACNHENIPLIHSEFGALIAEKWKSAMNYEKNKPKREMNSLLYQSRNNEKPVPNITQQKWIKYFKQNL